VRIVPLEVHRLVKTREQKGKPVRATLDAAGLKPPESLSDRYPQEVSSGPETSADSSALPGLVTCAIFEVVYHTGERHHT